LQSIKAGYIWKGENMHGQNKLRPRESNKEGLLQVQDIWPTLQGEGPFQGTPAIFIRLTGCNLACSFCDTKWDDEKDLYMSPEDIYSRVHEINYRDPRPNGLELRGAQPGWFEYKLVVLTGGEPARQDLTKLIEALVEGGSDGYHVQIETAGTYWQDIFAYPCVTLVCSPKTEHVHPKILEYCKHWKYVIQYDQVNIYDGLPSSPTQNVTEKMIKDFIPAEQFAVSKEDNPASLQPGGLYHTAVGGAKFGSPRRPPVKPGKLITEGSYTVWLSPCDDPDPEITRKNHLMVGKLCMMFGYRATVQLHKLLDLP
jgi:7-carboxy-7-deazaguanine synthase